MGSPASGPPPGDDQARSVPVEDTHHFDVKGVGEQVDGRDELQGVTVGSKQGCVPWPGLAASQPITTTLTASVPVTARDAPAPQPSPAGVGHDQGRLLGVPSGHVGPQSTRTPGRPGWPGTQPPSRTFDRGHLDQPRAAHAGGDPDPGQYRSTATVRRRSPRRPPGRPRRRLHQVGIRRMKRPTRFTFAQRASLHPVDLTSPGTPANAAGPDRHQPLPGTLYTGEGPSAPGNDVRPAIPGQSGCTTRQLRHGMLSA